MASENVDQQAICGNLSALFYVQTAKVGHWALFWQAGNLRKLFFSSQGKIYKQELLNVSLNILANGQFAKKKKNWKKPNGTWFFWQTACWNVYPSSSTMGEILPKHAICGNHLRDINLEKCQMRKGRCECHYSIGLKRQ